MAYLFSESAPSSSCGQVQSMIVVGAKSAVAFRTFPLSRLVTCAQAIPAEYVEALCEYSIFTLYLARRTSQCLLILPQFLCHHFIQCFGEFDLLHTLDLASKLRYFLLQYNSCIYVILIIDVRIYTYINNLKHTRKK